MQSWGNLFHNDVKSFAWLNFLFVSGMYCKWLMKGHGGTKLNLELDDMNIFPLEKNCGYDGLVIYDGNSTKGRKYGSNSPNLIK